jgi:putative ABC transport system permease protein
MTSDLRLALRMLWKDKAFTLTAAITLALCIGANTALFSVVHNVLLRPLAVPDSDRIMLTSNSYPKAGADSLGNSGVPDYFDRLRDVSAFEEQALLRTRSQTIDQNGSPTRVRVMQVTPSFFRLVRVSPTLGRIFTSAEGEVGQEKKAILSYAMWQAGFGGDGRVIGRDVRTDGQLYTIVGVMPRDFSFIEHDTMMWVPAAFTPNERSDDQRHSNNWMNVGRLRPGATIQQAQSQVDALNAANLKRFPQYAQLLVNAGFNSPVFRLQEFLVRDVKPTLFLMWGGALFVLLIGAVNVANLVLVRSRARIKELATRLALGASRRRVARQLVTESVLLTWISAAGGLAIGYLALEFLGTLNIQDLPRGDEIRLDGVAVAYTIAVAGVMGIALGLIPIANIVPANITLVLREEGRTGTSGRGARTLRRVLVVTQVAFAFVLLIGAGLLFASFRRVLAVDPGYRPEGVLTASIRLPNSRYADAAALGSFGEEALRRVRALPGVTVAATTDWVPLSGDNNDSVILAEGYQMKPGESVISPAMVRVSDGYFEAMGATLVRGRFFDRRDGAAAPKVIIVDEKLARRFWPDQDPIGRRMYFPTDLNHLVAVTEKTVFYTVVGVVREMKLHDLAEGSKTVGAYYFPQPQNPSRYLAFTIKTNGDPAALTRAVRNMVSQLDPELPVFDVHTMEQRLAQSLTRRRSPVMLSLSFGIVALFLSAIGIYGVLAYLVTQRTREIGIRIALGSSAGSIFELVLREGLLLIGAGFAGGAVGAVALRRSLESQLFGVSAFDPAVIGAVTVLLALTAAFACVVPARRATRIDPVVALAD